MCLPVVLSVESSQSKRMFLNENRAEAEMAGGCYSGSSLGHRAVPVAKLAASQCRGNARMDAGD